MDVRLLFAFPLAIAIATCSSAGGVSGSERIGAPMEAPVAAANVHVRRLTNFEYDNTVRDLLGDDSAPSRAFPGDSDQTGFANDAATSAPTSRLVHAYRDAAERLAARFVATRPSSDLVRFAARAFRRPITSEEARALVDLEERAGAESVVEVTLQSPDFLYRIDHGAEASQYEIASRLSYLLWSTMPDDALMAAADAEQLSTREEIAAQARRMLDDDRAKNAIEAFHLQWLGLNGLDVLQKDRARFPQFTDDARDALGKDMRLFVDDVVLRGDAKLGTLITSGLLTKPAVLAKHAKMDSASPVLRGKLVRERLFCQPIAPPPMDVGPPPPARASERARERFDEHAIDPRCAECHALMDPIGFVFDRYDAIGAYDAKSDESGELTGTDVDGKYVGAASLARALAKSDEVKDCYATQWFRFAFGRHETSDDAATLAELRSAFRASDGNIRELLVALAVEASGF